METSEAEKEGVVSERFIAIRPKGSTLSVIMDNWLGEKVRGRGRRIRTFKDHASAEREARKLNAPSPAKQEG